MEERKVLITGAAHGCCSGSDVRFHRILREVCGRSVYVAGFPSTHRSRTEEELDCNFLAEPKPPMARNGDILAIGKDQLLAFPRLMHEELRSGTWATIRLARKLKMSIKIFWRESGKEDQDQG